MIIIIDFGSQSTHLISRRINEFGVKTKIILPDEKVVESLKDTKVQGVILSGGPSSVYEKNSPTLTKDIFTLKLPMLGICYGQQLMSYLLDGDVKPGKIREYGPANITIKKDSSLLENTSHEFNVWMSHGDSVIKPPKGFVINAITKTIPVAVMSDEKRKLYGIQFHPELVHTQFGETILSNFLKICGLFPKLSPLNKKYIEEMIEDIKESVGKEKAICALSGGVDSSVAALLVHKAIGTKLTSFYIDSGLMRKGETDVLKKVFKNEYHMKVQIIDAKIEFLTALKGITDPETKRKIIGKTFIEIFDREAKKIGATFLVQGTIYPDVIESPAKYADVITSTTHKTLRGPRSAMILMPEKNAQKVDKAVFPGMQGGPLENVIAAKAVCFKEALDPSFKDYAKQVVKNAKAMADQLASRGLRLVCGGTETHLVLVDLTPKGISGKDAQIALEEAGIITNRNAIPFDPKPPFVTSGLRVGSAALTTRGFNESDMKHVADLIVKVIENHQDQAIKEKVSKEVEELCAKYPIYKDLVI
jgi:GMP synthase (glutamine-hydrolysing) A subunit